MLETDSTHSLEEGLAAVAGGISVIMPVYNGVDFISESLPPLVAMQERGEVLEIIVVDDGSTDDTAAMAAAMGARVIPSGGRLGPGGARNQAAELARGEIIWFVDADVVLHTDAAKKLARGFDDSTVVAVFGSYDDNPPARNFFSQYKNLVHHYYHHLADEEARTFWSGCGAVRREAFLAVGGFDIERYKYPSIEDIELGHRLIKAGGRILLRQEILCTHLKVWRFGNLLHTEIFRRAIPWSRLIINGSGMHNDLNIGMGEQARAFIAGLFVLVILGTVAGLLHWGLIVVAFILVVAANREISVFFFRRKGLLFTLGALLYHQVYYLYSATAFAWVVVEQGVLKLAGRGEQTSLGAK